MDPDAVRHVQQAEVEPREEIRIGDLVRFVPIETGVDTLCADGTREVDPISRLFKDICSTIGTVVDGPFTFNELKVWLVLVRGDLLHFEGGHLVAVKSH